MDLSARRSYTCRDLARQQEPFSPVLISWAGCYTHAILDQNVTLLQPASFRLDTASAGVLWRQPSDSASHGVTKQGPWERMR